MNKEPTTHEKNRIETRRMRVCVCVRVSENDVKMYIRKQNPNTSAHKTEAKLVDMMAMVVRNEI